jgi:hypothetical protein
MNLILLCNISCFSPSFILWHFTSFWAFREEMTWRAMSSSLRPVCSLLRLIYLRLLPVCSRLRLVCLHLRPVDLRIRPVCSRLRLIHVSVLSVHVPVLSVYVSVPSIYVSVLSTYFCLLSVHVSVLTTSPSCLFTCTYLHLLNRYKPTSVLQFIFQPVQYIWCWPILTDPHSLTHHKTLSWTVHI